MTEVGGAVLPNRAMTSTRMAATMHAATIDAILNAFPSPPSLMAVPPVG
jgi:hypothetical protein